MSRPARQAASVALASALGIGLAACLVYSPEIGRVLRQIFGIE